MADETGGPIDASEVESTVTDDTSGGASAVRLSRAYTRLLEKARAIPTERQEVLGHMAWWSGAETKEGTPVFVVAPRGFDGQLEGTVDMWELLLYATTLMHEHVVEQNRTYAAVWIQAGDHRMWPLSAWKFRRALHKRFFDNVDAVHAVHPSMTVRLYELVLWPFVEDSFWDRFITHERIEFVGSHFDVDKLGLPQDLFEYDGLLDAESRLFTEQASIMVGGAGFSLEAQVPQSSSAAH